eukprot:1061088-Amphidinium_carterae.1
MLKQAKSLKHDTIASTMTETVMDQTTALSEVAKNAEALKHLPDEWRMDREVALKAVAQMGFAIEWVHEDLRTHTHTHTHVANVSTESRQD